MPRTVEVAPDVSAAELLARVGLLSRQEIPGHLQLYVQQVDRAWPNVQRWANEEGGDAARLLAFQQLLVDIAARVLSHPVIAANRYLERFADGVTEAQARHECQQFSVFTIHLDVARAKAVANAPTLQHYQEQLYVLLNEKGVPFEKGYGDELTGVWTPESVHFAWIQKMAEGLGLTFDQIGKIWLAQPGTVALVETTMETYAGADASIARGAAFALNCWSTNMLWKPWIAGMEQLNESRSRPVNISYLYYHECEQEHRSQKTIDRLWNDFGQTWFDASRFLTGAERILTDGVQAYYVSQLETLPERDPSWPTQAVEERQLAPEELPRLTPASLPIG